jgi:hypothetical protein
VCTSQEMLGTLVDTAPLEPTNIPRKMLYCEVLIGMTVAGNSSMLEPPVINPAVSATDRYDSTVDNVATPTIL